MSIFLVQLTSFAHPLKPNLLEPWQSAHDVLLKCCAQCQCADVGNPFVLQVCLLVNCFIWTLQSTSFVHQHLGRTNICPLLPLAIRFRFYMCWSGLSICATGLCLLVNCSLQTLHSTSSVHQHIEQTSVLLFFLLPSAFYFVNKASAHVVNRVCHVVAHFCIAGSFNRFQLLKPLLVACLVVWCTRVNVPCLTSACPVIVCWC